MAVPWGAIASGGLSLVGDYFNNQAQQQNNERQIQLSRDQMAWQEKMSNTAHQREMKDMVRSGLNPVLSSGGSGASTPNGSVPNLTAPQINTPAIMSSFTDFVKMDQEQQKIDIGKVKATADISKKGADTDLARAKELLAKKGAPRAILEGEAAEVLKKGIQYLKEQMHSNGFGSRRGPPRGIPRKLNNGLD